MRSDDSSLASEKTPKAPNPQAPPATAPRKVPLHEHLGINPRFVSGGQSRIELVIAPHHLRSRGITHGGVFAALLDAAQGMAAASLAPEGCDVVTVQLNVNFIRPATLGERLTATANVQHAGRRTAVTSGEVHTAAGLLSATGTATLLYIPLAEAAPSTSTDAQEVGPAGRQD